MKKPLILSIALATALALTGCANEQPQEQAAESTAAPAAGAQGDVPPAATLEEVNKAAGKEVKLGQHVKIETTKGTFEVVMFPEAAPKTVENFVTLAKAGFYDGTSFHRVIPGFVAQGGDPLSKELPPGDPKIGTGGADKNIPGEFEGGTKHLRGSLAMARSQDPNSASSQFYVSFQPIPHLDGNYAIFGHVVDGMDVVASLNPTERDGAAVTEPAPDKIVKMTVLEQ